MFLENKQFPFTETLESRWQEVQTELDQLPSKQFMSWHEKHLYTQDWSVVGLYAFGEQLSSNCQLCPKTVELLSQIPGIYNAGFSKLKPGTHIQPHKGYSGALLRCHLGLRVPESCGIQVAGETRHWQEGQCLVFDDTLLHNAWNDSNSDRVVLLLDFRKEGVDFNWLDKLKFAFIRVVARRYLK